MKRYLIFLSVVGALVMFVGCESTNMSSTNKDTTNKTQKDVAYATVSGTIHFVGLKPDAGEKGTLVISARKHGSDDLFEKIKLVTQPTLVDNATWKWNDAVEGETYDLQATLAIEGQQITKSDIATATAPATDIELPIRVTWSELPTTDREKSFKKIGGDIRISGYVPADATVTIYTAKARDNSELQPEEVDNPQFNAVVKNVAASTNKKWYWDEALGHIDYLVKSELYSKGILIGASDIVHASVPQEDVTMQIVSKAKAPIQKVVISGVTHLDGSYKKNSKIIVSIRENGKGGFAEIASFPAESSREWKYEKAKNGVEYDVRAALVQNDEEVARSSQKHIVAPTKDIKLKIDTGMSLKDPDQKPYLVECKKKDSKKYDAKITFPGIGDARSYWVKVGTSKHSGNRFNEAERPKSTGDDLTIKMRVDKDKDYYVEYAYSYCKDCETLDSFSDFSPHAKFSCPE